MGPRTLDGCKLLGDQHFESSLRLALGAGVAGATLQFEWAKERRFRIAARRPPGSSYGYMRALLIQLRHHPLLWLLPFVPAVLVAEVLAPDAHTALFVLSILAVVPLAALLHQNTANQGRENGGTARRG